MNRRAFLRQAGVAVSGVTLLPLMGCRAPYSGLGSKGAATARGFRISLAEWSFHRAISEQKTMVHLDFPLVARRQFGMGRSSM